ncbi:ferrous iron transporter B [Thermaurantiacus sp.]
MNRETAIGARVPLVAVAGHPNAGKTSLFNALTGARQKVANYPGVTVERTSARLVLGSGREIELLDLPGAYSLDPRSPDEAVTRDALLGRIPGQPRPDLVLAVLDATSLGIHLRFLLELRALGLPLVVALNRVDMAARDGTRIDTAALAARLGLPVIETVAVRRRGLDALLAEVEAGLDPVVTRTERAETPATDLRALARAARALAGEVTLARGPGRALTDRIDRVVLHPLIGPLLLAFLLFLMFQAVFTLAGAPMGWIEAGIGSLQRLAAAAIPPGLLRSAITEGLLAGVGSVLVFLPQILILFAFILALEGSGYLGRAAFLADRLMARAGLSGMSFIPLLSSFACAIPGIMAARTVADPKARLATILVAPLMTCSARLPVYAVVIAAFIPATTVWGPIGLQGLVLFGLYVAGAVGGFLAALAMRATVARGASLPLLMELPAYQMPAARDLAIGLWVRVLAFLKRAGTIILMASLALWLLASFPRAGAAPPPLADSYAGRIGTTLQPLVAPLGFGPDIALALVPAMAAREVAVSALGTVYAIEAEDPADGLVERLRGAWPLPTALAFLAWFVFAPQCISTIAVARRETNSWRWPLFMLAYLFALAWGAAFVVNRVAIALLPG